MITLEELVVKKLKATQHLLCTIESCTGGLIAHLITNISGASEIYWGSVVAYDNSVKEELGVPPSLIASQGAVSPEVAREMAEHGLKKMQNNSSRIESFALLKPKGLICVSTTGIAGPGGGTSEKPVGLCYIGLARSGQKTIIEKILLSPPLDRIQTKTQFAKMALDLIRLKIEEAP